MESANFVVRKQQLPAVQTCLGAYGNFGNWRVWKTAHLLARACTGFLFSDNNIWKMYYGNDIDTGYENVVVHGHNGKQKVFLKNMVAKVAPNV
jgi:hypothetical protein